MGAVTRDGHEHLELYVGGDNGDRRAGIAPATRPSEVLSSPSAMPHLKILLQRRYVLACLLQTLASLPPFASPLSLECLANVRGGRRFKF
jgi:hypothetical protein